MISIAILAAVAFSACQASYEWFPYQKIETLAGNDAEFFTIGSTNYLAFAEEFSANIFAWNGHQFAKYQTIAHAFCLGVTFFEIDGNSYLAVSSYINDYGTIYQWSTKSNQFLEYQQIHVSQPRKFKFAQIGSDSYIAVTNNVGHSNVYLWDGKQFNLFQQVPTNQPQELAFLTVNSTTFLAVAAGGSNPSLLYAFSAKQNKFVELASFAGVNQATDVAFWTVGYEVFVGFSSLTQVTWIWQWNFGTSAFDLIQALENTSGDYSLTPISAGSSTFLAIAATGTAPLYEATSQLFEWNGNEFSLYQNISTNFVEKFAVTEISGNFYLAAAEVVSNHSELISSVVYKWVNL